MSTFKKIVAFSLIFVICSISLLGSVVSVYADSITSLPAHSNIVSSFDANNIYLETPDGDYIISRKTKLSVAYYSSKYIISYVTGSGYNFFDRSSNFSKFLDNNNGYIYAPSYFEYDSNFNKVDASYWYSPSQNKVYIINSCYSSFYGCSSSRVLSYYGSDSGSSFRVDVDNVPGLSCLFVCLYDLNTSKSWISLGQGFSSMKRTTLSGFYFSEDYYLDGYNYLSYYEYCSFPSDLLCIYSSYPIDGFWEVNPLSDLVTPDYYFNYQYLFEGINNYFIFIDSSKPITDFIYSDGTIKFSDLCNKRIYVTTDGVSWVNICSSELMYSGAFTLDAKYYKSDNPDDPFTFRLVYSNDVNYGQEPLVKPEFNNNFTKFDFYSKFPTFIEEYVEGESDWSNAYHTVFPSNGTEDFNALQFLLYGGYGAVSDLLSILGISSDHLDSFVDQLFGVDNISFSDAFILNIFNNLTQEFNYKYDSLGNLVSRTRTIYGYLKNVSENLYDTKLLIDQFRLDILSPLGSLFDISSFNADRLVDITALIKGIKIPDYSKKFDSIITSLASSSVPSFDDSGIIAAINNITIPDYTLKLDAIISAINNGGGSSPTVSVDLDKLYKLLDFDISDYDDDKTDDDTRVVDFVVDGLNDLVSGSVLQNALDFAPGVLSGIGLVNGFVVNIYDNLGNYKPVVLLGLTFTVVGTVIRKEEA